RRELGFTLVAVGAFDHAQEGLLQQIFRLLAAAHEAEDEVVHGLSMPREEHLERTHVATLIACHERLVGLVRQHRRPRARFYSTPSRRTMNVRGSTVGIAGSKRSSGPAGLACAGGRRSAGRADRRA